MRLKDIEQGQIYRVVESNMTEKWLVKHAHEGLIVGDELFVKENQTMDHGMYGISVINLSLKERGKEERGHGVGAEMLEPLLIGLEGAEEF